MTEPGEYTRREILSQPEAWTAALERIRAEADGLRRFYGDGRYEAVIFTGCGSTYYLSLAAAALFESRGIEARALPASELWLYPHALRRRALLIAVSRSGETTETLRAVESFRARKQGDVLTLSCYGEKPLAGMGTINLVLPSGQEQSVAQTRAFSVLYLAVTALAALWSDPQQEQADPLAALDRLAQAGRRLIERFSPVARGLGADAGLDRFYFLGSGARYGLAAELSLKMKEMSLSHSEPFPFMEFRHGPQSMVTESTLMIGLLSDEQRAAESAVLDEMRGRGARVLSLGEDGAELTVRLESGVAEALRGALYLPIGQLLAFERAISRGLDPDRPHNLTAVVRLDEQE